MTTTAPPRERLTSALAEACLVLDPFHGHQHFTASLAGLRDAASDPLGRTLADVLLGYDLYRDGDYLARLIERVQIVTEDIRNEERFEHEDDGLCVGPDSAWCTACERLARDLHTDALHDLLLALGDGARARLDKAAAA